MWRGRRPPADHRVREPPQDQILQPWASPQVRTAPVGLKCNLVRDLQPALPQTPDPQKLPEMTNVYCSEPLSLVRFVTQQITDAPALNLILAL